MKVRGDFLGPPRSTDKTTLIIKVSKVAKIRNLKSHHGNTKEDIRHCLQDYHIERVQVLQK